MPKATKRAAYKKAAKIAKAHVTDIPKMEAKPSPRSSAREKRGARGLARYPWAVTIILIALIAPFGYMYYTHTGVFAPYVLSAQAKAATATVTVKTATAAEKAAVAACTSNTVVKELTDTATPLSSTEVAKITHTYSAAPSMSITTSKLYCVGINTSKGLIILKLDPKIAPATVNNFVFLAEHNYYDGLTFHRVLDDSTGHIIQGGDPKGDGSGGPGYTIKDETVIGNYTAGCVAMAKTSAANSGGSQFFICTKDDSSLYSKSYTIFGEVVSGLNIAQKIAAKDVMNYVKVVAVSR